MSFDQDVLSFEIPELDDLMPPLDRNGKRGPRTKEERDYEARREQLGKMLEQSRRTQEALSEAQATTRALRQQFGEETAAAMSTAIVDIVRLTGDEPRGLRFFTEGEDVLVSFNMDAAQFIIRWGRDAHCVTAYATEQEPMDFDLNGFGQLPDKDFLALRSYLGVTRRPSESYPQRVIRSLYGAPDPMAMKRFGGPLGLTGPSLLLPCMRENHLPCC